MSEPKMTKVTFGSLEIWEHPIVLGDNPSVSEGVPISIGWKAQSHEEYTVDSFEAKRRRRKRRSRESFRLRPQDRAVLAMKGGSTLGDIGRCCVAVDEIKNSRAKSMSKSDSTWKKLRSGAVTSLTFLPNALKSAVKATNRSYKEPINMDDLPEDDLEDLPFGSVLEDPVPELDTLSLSTGSTLSEDISQSHWINRAA